MRLCAQYHRLKIDNQGRFVTEYKEKKEQALRYTQYFPRHLVHRVYIMKTYATDMQSVAVMSDMVWKEYFKALAAEFSTNDKKDR